MGRVKKKKIVIHRFHKMDHALVLTALILSLAGIVLAFSASYYYSISKFGSPYTLMIQNVSYVALGWLVLLLLSRIDYHVLRRFALPALAVGLVLLVAVLVLRGTPFTRTLNNATRWLDFGISIMPGELIKPALILFLAAWYSADPGAVKSLKGTGITILLLAAIFVLIFKQPNLSTAVIVLSLGAVMMLLAGLTPWALAAGGGLGALGFVYLYFINDGYMHTRLVTAFDPWADTLGEGYQVVQSLLALGSGGVLGKGLGQSIQKTLYLPEPQSDFILPIIGEEIGFVGILVILILYAILIGRIISIALRAKDVFGAYLAGGTGALIAIHIILNIMVVTASFPPTGVFLPFMSQGGNATLVFLALIGIVLNISRQSDDIPEEEGE